MNFPKSASDVFGQSKCGAFSLWTSFNSLKCLTEDFGNSLDKLRHTRSVAYSAELVCNMCVANSQHGSCLALIASVTNLLFY